MKQKDIFLNTEGDAWYRRNKDSVAARRLPDEDPLLMELIPLLPPGRTARILEIGCGDGTRLAWLQRNADVECFGVDPSKEAAVAACAAGINARQGTADELPYDSGAFDFVIFGFCLYLCDREDLFRIAGEANRVLGDSGWLLILDFFSPVPRSRRYHHADGIYSFKMDYRKLFDWHPAYECTTHRVRHHETGLHTDDPDEWVALSVLRKLPETRV